MHLITGAAGFIGSHAASTLLSEGHDVLAIDRIAANARIEALACKATYLQCDLTDPVLEDVLASYKNRITHVIHLAAHTGIRASFANPSEYERNNNGAQKALLKWCGTLPRLKHVVYASSSSVYGDSTKLPFCEADALGKALSPYAATKQTCEQLANDCDFPITGLRFFTAYGPWGRPDMAYYLFTRAISEGTAIRLFNDGVMTRDFTYIDDIIAGLISALGKPSASHTIYNLGSGRAEKTSELVSLLETILGRKAVIHHEPAGAGEMQNTIADITRAKAELHYQPRTILAEGLEQFTRWYLGHG